MKQNKRERKSMKTLVLLKQTFDPEARVVVKHGRRRHFTGVWPWEPPTQPCSGHLLQSPQNRLNKPRKGSLGEQAKQLVELLRGEAKVV